MAKVFAVNEGAEIRIGNYGTARADLGVEIPDELAADLSAISSLRVERETKPKAPQAETIAPKTETKPAKGEKE